MPDETLDQIHKSFVRLKRFAVFWSGLRLAVSGDRTVAVQVVISLVVVVLAFLRREWLDMLLILIVTGFMLSIELMNTALESLSDYIQPDYDLHIGAIKNIASAASGLFVIWVVTITVELGRLWLVLRG